MTPFRMLVVDLDGTALCGHDQLREDDVRAARALKAQGVQVTIATGRLAGGTHWVAEQLGVEKSYAVMNGSARLEMDGRTAYHRALPQDLLRELGDHLRAEGIESFHFAARHIAHGPHSARHADYLGIWTPELQQRDLHHSPSWDRDDVLAVGAIGPGVHAVQAALTDPRLEVVGFPTYGGEPFLSVRLNEDDKGTALHALAAERGLTAAQVVAVGDWWNDIPMLQTAGLGFAMQGAGEGAIDAADDTLDARRGEGGAIAEIARRVWGIEV